MECKSSNSRQTSNKLVTIAGDEITKQISSLFRIDYT